MKQNESFNPCKCLLYKDNFDGLINKKLLPPIEVNIDPITSCNLNCYWCNAHRVKDNQMIPFNQLMKVLDDMAYWGVKGICFAGGGEPTLYPELAKIIEECSNLNLESSIITNGFSMTNELIRSIVLNMRWIGISVDAAKPETFKKMKKVDGFERTINNIKKLVAAKKELNSSIGITYKFLISVENQYEITDAAILAKIIGCDSIHFRPIDYKAFEAEQEELDVKEINFQAEICQGYMDDETFDVIPYFINFDKKLHRKITFNSCELSPLLGVCLPSGWWVCIDRKGVESLKLCDLHDIRKFWGSQKHFELLKKIDPQKDCGKCTLAKYYPYFDNYRKDKYYWKFI